jgi:hypothetical protein
MHRDVAVCDVFRLSIKLPMLSLRARAGIRCPAVSTSALSPRKYIFFGWQVGKGVRQLTVHVLKPDWNSQDQCFAYGSFWGAKTNVFEV